MLKPTLRAGGDAFGDATDLSYTRRVQELGFGFDLLSEVSRVEHVVEILDPNG